MVLGTYELPDAAAGPVFSAPLKIYTGLLGQIGDIVLFTPTLRRLKQLFPNSFLTFAVSARYREAGELVTGLPYVDRLFVTRLYFEKLTPPLFQPWERGWPVDLRGDDEVLEQRKHDLVLETRPRHRHSAWWEFGHVTEELAQRVGVPGPIEARTEIRIPPGTAIASGTEGKIVVHNDPNTDPRKAWSWESVCELVGRLGEGRVVLIGQSGPPVAGVRDLRGKTTLAQTAAILAHCACFIGIESGPICLAASLQIPTVGLFGTSYVPAYQAVQPDYPNATYLQAQGGLEQISVEAVWEALTRMVAL